MRAGHVGLSGVLSHCKANLEKPGHHLRLSEERIIIKLAKAEEENIDTDTAVTRHLESFHCTDHAVRFGQCLAGVRSAAQATRLGLGTEKNRHIGRCDTPGREEWAVRGPRQEGDGR